MVDTHKHLLQRSSQLSPVRLVQWPPSRRFSHWLWPAQPKQALQSSGKAAAVPIQPAQPLTLAPRESIPAHSTTSSPTTTPGAMSPSPRAVVPTALPFSSSRRARKTSTSSAVLCRASSTSRDATTPSRPRWTSSPPSATKRAATTWPASRQAS